MFANVRSDEHQIRSLVTLIRARKLPKLAPTCARVRARESAGDRGTFVKGCIGSPSFRERTTYRIRAAVGQRNFSGAAVSAMGGKQTQHHPIKAVADWRPGVIRAASHGDHRCLEGLRPNDYAEFRMVSSPSLLRCSSWTCGRLATRHTPQCWSCGPDG